MSNSSITWGYGVGNLLINGRITCQTISTSVADILPMSVDTRGKLGVLPKVTSTFPKGFTQLKIYVSYLLQRDHIHISTYPITTTKKKGLKK